jgi:hypothetical protein
MVKYSESPTVEVSVEVETTAEQLWALVTDVDLPARFSEEYQGGEWLDGAEPAVGSRFRGRNQHPAAGEWTTESTVVGCEEGRLFSWAVGDPSRPAATWRFELEPAGDRTRLRMWAEMGPGPSGLTPIIEAHPDREDDIVERRLDEWRTNMLATVAGLKQLAEST